MPVAQAKPKPKSKRSTTAKAPQNRVSPLLIALALIAVLGCFLFLPLVNSTPRLMWSFVGAIAVLAGFLLLLWRQVAKTGRQLVYEFQPRPVHYVQFVMHSSIYVYWGWYWREVYRDAPLIVAQIVFVYVLDMLVCWSRRDKWIMGFGPIPIVLSTNLFLWFKPNWFFLQFLMVSTGVLCKEFVTWQKEGRRAHIFNPSSIGLCLFSVVLILTHSTHITWGEEIAISQQIPPYIYLELFGLGLVVQFLFSVTLVTLSGAATLYILNLLYTHFTGGLYFFVDSGIPAAVFLGLHLLITDPATSPKKNAGKIVFGSAYGAGVFGLYWLLSLFGVPTFYDKLLCVPPLNLTVRWLDRLSTAAESKLRFPQWSPKRANLAFMGAWICLFTVMYATGFLGSHFPGQDSEFWRQKCLAGNGSACKTWRESMNISCSHGAGQSCVALGAALDGGMLTRDGAAAAKNFAHACELGLKPGCAGILRVVKQDNGSALQNSCDRGDAESCFLLGSLTYAGSGVAKDPAHAFNLLQRSCDANWPRGCAGLAELYRAGVGAPLDESRALEEFDKACRADVASSCFSASSMYRDRRQFDQADDRLRHGCQLSREYMQSTMANSATGATSLKLSIPPACSSLDQ
jgi:hypothetical protein